MIATLALLNLFLLPKQLGTYKGEEIEVNNGRFGTYVKFGTQFISLPKGVDPMDVTMETAQVLTENVGSDKGKLVPTDIGIIVNDFLEKNFGTILDYNLTAKVEQDFDEIAEGKEDWSKMMRDFYNHFHPIVANVENNAERETGE